MYFFEPKHIYYKKFLGDYDYISGSGVVKIVENEYDNVYWSLYKAYEFFLYRKNIDNTIPIDVFLETKPEASKVFFKNYKRQYKSLDYRLFDHLRMFADESKVKLIQKYILESWKKTNKNSLQKGSLYHNDREQAALNAEFAKNPFTKNILPIIKNNEWIDVNTNQSIIDLNNIEPGFYPEIILYYDMFCGRADKVWFEDIGRDKLGFWIDDWKTNAKLNFENKYQNLKYPLSHIADCNWNHYRIQLSFYIWILIQHGYHYMGSKLTHCVQNPDDLTWKKTGYHFDYLENEMNSITNHIKQYCLHIK